MTFQLSSPLRLELLTLFPCYFCFDTLLILSIKHCNPLWLLATTALSYYYYYYYLLTSIQWLGFFPRQPGWAGTRKVTILEQEMMGWQWHRLDHMQIICISLPSNNHANTSPLSFYRQDARPVAQPTASKLWRHSATALSSAYLINGTVAPPTVHHSPQLSLQISAVKTITTLRSDDEQDFETSQLLKNMLFPPTKYNASVARNNYGFYGSTSCCISQRPMQCDGANFHPAHLGNCLTNLTKLELYN